MSGPKGEGRDGLPLPRGCWWLPTGWALGHPSSALPGGLSGPSLSTAGFPVAAQQSSLHSPQPCCAPLGYTSLFQDGISPPLPIAVHHTSPGRTKPSRTSLNPRPPPPGSSLFTRFCPIHGPADTPPTPESVPAYQD